MSPVVVNAKPRPAGKSRSKAHVPDVRLTAKDWLLMVSLWLGACLLLMGLHWLFSGEPVIEAVPAEAVGSPAPASPAPAATPEPAPAEERKVVMHADEVQATVDSLRQHAKESPEAPDALSEEEIRAIEEKGVLIL